MTTGASKKEVPVASLLLCFGQNGGRIEMALFNKLASAISRYAAYCAAAIVVLMLLHITAEILLRNLFGLSTYVMEEFVGYGVATSAFLAMGYSLQTGALIRVSLVLDRLHGPWKRLLEAACCLLAGSVMSVLIWSSIKAIQKGYLRGYTSGTLADVPLYIPQAIMTMGMVIFCLQILSYLILILGNKINLDESKAIDIQ